METYQNLLIVYYSGTGNAKRVAEWIAQTAQERTINTQIYSYQEFINLGCLDNLRGWSGKTLIGFCSATHGFNLPHSFLKLIVRFKLYPKSDVFICNTRAGMKVFKFFLPGLSGLAQVFPALVLRLKGYKVVAMQPIDLSSNWISLHPALTDKMNAAIYEHWKKKTLDFANRMLDREKFYCRAWITLPIDLALVPIAIGYYLVGRFVFSKTFFASSDCDNCGYCIKSCPTKSIELVDNRPFWKLTCESCMHCLNFCPKRAIQVAHNLFFVLIALKSLIISPFIVEILTKYLKNYAILNQTLIQILQPAVTVLTFVIFYQIFHYLMRFKWFQTLVKYTTITRFKFWRRYRIQKQ